MNKHHTSFDLVIVGGGPGGYVAALRASQLKLRVALVERESLGGICLNWGCIPTKALLHSAELVRRIRDAGAHGISIPEPQIDFGKLMQRSRAVAQRLNKGVAHLLRKAGVTVFFGSAELMPDRHVQVSKGDTSPLRLQAEHVIVATGARAKELSVLPFDGERVWAYRDALSASRLPESLVVIGAGAIGMELASFYATLGTQVTVLESAPRVLPSSDQDVSEFVQRRMEREGVQFLTSANLVSGQVHADGVQLMVDHQGKSLQLRPERVLVAVGLVGNSEGLGLERTRVSMSSGLIEVHDWGRTDEPGIYAVGDITGPPMLAHKASHEGIGCVEHLAGLRSGAQPRAVIPSCVFSHPQSASVGLTEAQARQRGAQIRVGKFSLEGNGKAVAIGDTEGFIKTVFDDATGELLGAHLVGAETTELVHGYTLATTLESTEAELMDTIFPHPTLSEGMHEAVLAAFGRALHI